MDSKEVAFEIANNDKFFGIGITLEDMESIVEEAEKLLTNESKNPITWKEYKTLNSEKKIHTKEEYIKEYGILLMPNDVQDFADEQARYVKTQLKELFDRFLEENF